MYRCAFSGGMIMSKLVRETGVYFFFFFFSDSIRLS